MARREAAIVIRRPLRTVFPFVADVENTRRFRSDIMGVRRTSGSPAARGATYRQVVKLLWRQLEMLMENVEYEPDRALSFIARGTNGVALRTTFGFQKIESRHTRVALTVEGDGRAPGALGRRLAKREVEALHDLKRTLESRPC